MRRSLVVVALLVGLVPDCGAWPTVAAPEREAA
jgi:hypothetical protein